MLAYGLRRRLLTEISLLLQVYYFSDDIDAKTGEVDGNIITFNEQDINAMYVDIQERASKIILIKITFASLS